MYKLFGLMAVALVAGSAVTTAEAAQRRASSLQTTSASGSTTSGFRQTLPYNPDPSRSTGNYPDWARRALIGRGTGGR
jgi:hypothetical protein